MAILQSVLYGQDQNAYYFSFKKLKNSSETLYDSWTNIIVHLPYAYQGRSMLTEIYALDASNATITGTENAEEYQNKLRNQ
jgi:hydroxymethylglutaryl-CoA synthase